ncbi:MAG: hypothetical protein JXO22_06690, partial [Phycisphaerae bacterium]|nr:hypothetical protein [Phycisphaerae bacterium]
MKPLDLDKLGPDLSAYLDGELSPERAAEIEQLLADSPAARRRLEEFRAVSDRVANLPRQRAPEALDSLLRKQVERHMLIDARPKPRTIRLYMLATRGLAAAAVLVACTFVGWQVLHRPPAATPTAPDTLSDTKDEDALEYVQLPPDTLERLRALGYIASDSEVEPTDGTAPALALADKGDAAARDNANITATRGIAELPADTAVALADRNAILEGVALDRSAAASHGVSKGETSAGLTGQPPVLDVVVVANSPEQAARVIDALGKWTETDEKDGSVAGGKATVTELGEPTGDFDMYGGRSAIALGQPTTEQTIELTVASEDVAPLLGAIETEAPDRITYGYVVTTPEATRECEAPPVTMGNAWVRDKDAAADELSLGTRFERIHEREELATTERYPAGTRRPDAAGASGRGRAGLEDAEPDAEYPQRRAGIATARRSLENAIQTRPTPPPP